jgi:uncharacterized protein YgiM (DUF1202 family)
MLKTVWDSAEKSFFMDDLDTNLRILPKRDYMMFQRELLQHFIAAGENLKVKMVTSASGYLTIYYSSFWLNSIDAVMK